MKIRNTLWILAGLLFPAVSALAIEKASILSPDRISWLRTHSVTHPNPLAQNMTMLAVSGLEDDCESLYFYSDKDPFLYSTVLTWISGENVSSVKVYFVTDVDRGPWGDNKSCKLTSFTIMR
jgi:hypothetical protein